MSEPVPKKTSPSEPAADAPAKPAGAHAVGGAPKADGGSDEARTWSLLLSLEREARRAESAAALGYTIVNQTRRLIAYRQAVLVRRPQPKRFTVEAVSNVATVERNAPYVVWLRAVLAHLDAQLDAKGQPRLAAPCRVTAEDLPVKLAAEWRDWWPAEVAWQPMPDAAGAPGGGLILVREGPAWTEAETVLLEQLADAYAHAWRALGGLKSRAGGVRAGKIVALGVALGLIGALAIPVRQSVIAPARVAPQNPLVVAAPLDGVVAEVFVAPNEAVGEGDLLVAFERAEVEANHRVAMRALAVAEAELQRAENEAFGDPRSKSEVALKRAEVELKRAEAAYSESLLTRLDLRAPRAGIAVFSDPNQFRGRPVRTGERLMQIAEPREARLAVELPVADAIEMSAGAPVSMFLDIDPLNPVSATLERASYEAAETPDGVLAYDVSATFPPGVVPPRIGLRGSAKIYGERVPLALYLFRRPIAAARQFIGF